ncbi:MAG: SDR family NAD(P)-dependent oxidoreductase [Candidatus Acidiferrales bacterium]
MPPFGFSMEDLLGRKQLHVDLEALRHELEGRSVLVTGAAGSIGSALCRQILEYGPKKLVCVDQSAAGLAMLQQGFSKRAIHDDNAVVVADVSDSAAMRRCFSAHQIEFVFHAAAHKHVPEMESKEAEAVTNNVFALASLLDVAEEHRCRAFVLISSDKAVNPASVMGATKRVGELMLASRPPGTMRCVSVRFGNVLGSSGSVIPILQEQLRRNLSLTITHPHARRLFMTAREAVSLVLQAFTIGRDGDILVLEMGAPVNILEMARSLIRLSGLKESAVKIEFIGLRPGEKLQEELFYADEAVTPTPCHEIKRVRRPYGSWPELERQLDALRASVTRGVPDEIRARLRDIVPEFRDWSAATALPDY